jgi:3-deoxy-D-manno-octulosonic-acid transferase
VSWLFNAIYAVLLVILAPWLLDAAWRAGKYRRGLLGRLLGRVPERRADRPCLWLHAVSVGEVKLLAPLLAAIERAHPQYECAISTTTAAGYALAQQKYGTAGRPVFYAPLDFSWGVARALDRLRPRAILLAELEIWPNLLAEASRRGVPVAVVNGRLGERSFRGYRRLRWLLAPAFAGLELAAVQSDEYARRFAALGTPPERVHVTGSLKFDGARTDRDNPATRRLAELAGIGPDDAVFLAGSTQEPEEALALAAYRELAAEHPRLRLILVPRHPERFDDVARLLERSGLPWRRRTELETYADGPRREKGQAPILLVDVVGELDAWWGTARVAYVGGSMGSRGGQNMIEPAAYGAAVSFGPRTHNFRDVVELLLGGGAAVVVRDGGELTSFLRRCLEEPRYAAELGRRARSLVAGQLGATERTMRLLEPLLSRPAASATRVDPPHEAGPAPSATVGADSRTATPL